MSIDSMFVRLHRPPKKVRRILAECRTPKEQWLFDRSRDRYDKSSEGHKLNETLRSAFRQGEIGTYERCRFIVSPNVGE